MLVVYFLLFQIGLTKALHHFLGSMLMLLEVARVDRLVQNSLRLVVSFPDIFLGPLDLGQLTFCPFLYSF